MQITPLTIEEAANNNFTHKIVLTYADIVTLTSGTGASVYPGFNETNTFPAGTYITDAAATVVTAFTGGTGTLAMTLGDGTTANKFLASLSLTATGFFGFNSTSPEMFNAAGQIVATVTAGTSILGWTAGEVHIYLNIANIPVLDT
jgi:hypothetical protein